MSYLTLLLQRSSRSIQTYCLMSMDPTETIANLQCIHFNTPFICSSCALVRSERVVFVSQKKTPELWPSRAVELTANDLHCITSLLRTSLVSSVCYSLRLWPVCLL